VRFEIGPVGFGESISVFNEQNPRLSPCHSLACPPLDRQTPNRSRLRVHKLIDYRSSSATLAPAGRKLLQCLWRRIGWSAVPRPRQVGTPVATAFHPRAEGACG